MKKILLLLGIFVLINCAEQPQQKSTTPVCKNIIFMIGDGMGVGHISATRIATVGPDSVLNMDRLPYTGFMKTHAADQLITDSAASGTAMACGYKTNNGVIGLTPDGKPVKNIVTACQEKKMSTGLVATSSITHATPAAMATHVQNRHQENEIAKQLVEKHIDVLLGGGLCFFLPASHSLSKRSDDLNLLKKAAQQGYTVVQTKKELQQKKAEKLLGLFAPDGMKTTSPEPSLADMTQKALQIVSKNQNGFFLMIEGSQIDWAGHDNDFAEMLRQTRLFDQSVRVALDFAKQNPNTLLLVTSDHETGGLGINKGDRDGKNLSIAWTSGSHTAEMIPIYAFGAGAEKFVGLKDNTEIAKIFSQLIGLEDFPNS